jgi:antitoxin (DNA-binding transcriptional repressor) of toxin-antitoxin stability system
MEASILDLRYRMKDVLRAIDRGEAVTVLYRGKPRAMLSPLSKGKLPKISSLPGFGMWKDRRDMKDPAGYVRKPRFS